MKIKSLILKYIVVLFFVHFFSIYANAQTFKCTDVVFNVELSERQQQKYKSNTLGVTVTLEFFKNDVKVTVNQKNERPTIMTKIGKDKYKYKQRETVEIIELNKILGFIFSVKYLKYENEKLIGTATFERDF